MFFDKEDGQMFLDELKLQKIDNGFLVHYKDRSTYVLKIQFCDTLETAIQFAQEYWRLAPDGGREEAASGD